MTRRGAWGYVHIGSRLAARGVTGLRTLLSFAAVGAAGVGRCDGLRHEQSPQNASGTASDAAADRHAEGHTAHAPPARAGLPNPLQLWVN